MQKNVNNILFTPVFIQKFKNVLNKMYDYESYMDFMIVPSIFGKKTLTYLPLLGYTDRDVHSIDDLLELSKENDFNIRVLNFDYDDFKADDTVTMRIDIEGLKSDEIFSSFKKQCRQSVRHAERNNFRFVCNNSQKNIDDFYELYKQSMHLHGTPSLSKDFFRYLVEEFNEEVLFFNVYDGDKAISAYCILLDKDIAWGAWSGADQTYKKELVGYFGLWESIKYISENKNIKIFDIGRSPYLGPTYRFKSKFGAYPVKIDILTSKEEDIYKKYSLASQVWKKLPSTVVDFIGPKLCKYLVDL